jgi:hypothetical protein
VTGSHVFVIVIDPTSVILRVAQDDDSNIRSVSSVKSVAQSALFLVLSLLPSVAFASDPFAKALAAPIVTIADKPQPSPTGDNRDYISYARYYWPNPDTPDGLPFVRRDGHHNREQVAAGDRGKVDRLVDAVTVLARGWTEQRRADCAVRAGEWLRAWFITPATRMTPGLKYAQVRLGHNGNLGNPPGVLDTRDFAQVVAVIPALRGSPALTAEEEQAIQAWFGEHYRWLRTAPAAQAEHAAKNNHGTWFLVQAAAIAHYLGRDDEARAWYEEDKARIAAQFAPDGSQPEEIRREDGLHYSHFNLQAHLQLAVQAKACGIDLWNYPAPNGAGLKKGIAYLRPYNTAPETWPHKEKEKKAPGFMDDILARAAELDRGTGP